ncbi:renalase-like [Oncorhynchus kisutch]|uniref:renalase-like n=1 Tax=Oncorhynchus kisutch TaxID=8019 RepID=UPI0012DFBA38|nr:renalase-like [Oncorhynchus kisutch]
MMCNRAFQVMRDSTWLPLRRPHRSFTSARGDSAAAAWGGKLLVGAMRWASSTKAQAHFDVPWAAKYVSNNPCIRFIAIDDQKRNLEFPECCPSMVVHISVPFGVKHLEEAKEQVEPIILVKLNKLLPGLPQPDSIKCQKWRYSQAGLGWGSEATEHLCGRPHHWECQSMGQGPLELDGP